MAFSKSCLATSSSESLFTSLCLSYTENLAAVLLLPCQRAKKLNELKERPARPKELSLSATTSKAREGALCSRRSTPSLSKKATQATNRGQDCRPIPTKNFPGKK